MVTVIKTRPAADLDESTVLDLRHAEIRNEERDGADARTIDERLIIEAFVIPLRPGRRHTQPEGAP